jgi:hypothetical protein
MLKLGSKAEQPILVLHHGPDRLSPEQIKEAFSGQGKAYWYRALMQKLNDLRHDNALNASQSASAQNTLAMAGGLSVYEALTSIMIQLAELTGDQSAQYGDQSAQ